MKKDDPRIPDLYVSHVSKIDFKALKNKGVTGLIFDVDNTLARRDCNAADPACGEVVKRLMEGESAFRICLVSNIIAGKKRRERVENIAKELGVPCVAAGFFERKPLPAPFLKGLELIDNPPENTAMIGDQIFTDVIGANRLGMYTVLVKPMGPDHWATSLLGRRKKEKEITDNMKIEDVSND